MAERKIDTKLAISGENEYKQACSNIKNSLSNVKSEMALVTAEFGKNDKSIEGLTAKQKVLKSQYDEQAQKVDAAKKALETYKAAGLDPTSEAYQKMEREINYASAALMRTEKELKNNETELATASKEGRHFGDEIKNAGAEADTSGGKFSKLGDIVAGVGKGFAVGMAAIGTAAVGAATALTALTVSGSNYADDVLTLSTNTHIATDDLQKYKYALNFIDGDIGTLTNTMKKNTQIMSKARDGNASYTAAYDKLGVSITDANGELRKGEDVYWETIDALGKVENITERDALAMTLLGKSGTELNTIIDAGSEAFKAYGDEAEAMGVVMSGENLNALGAFNDKLQTLKAGMEGLKNSAAMIALPFLDVLATDGISILGDFSKGIQEANGDAGKMADVMGTTISKAATMIAEKLPTFVDMGVKMISSIIKGLTDNLPTIVSAAVQIVKSLAQGLIDMLPLLIEGAMQIILELGKGLAEALPELIPKVVEVVVFIVKQLVENIPMLIECALQIIEGLAFGLIEALPALIEALPEIILAIVNGLIEGIPKIIESADKILMALITGLITAIPKLIAAIPQIISGIVTGLVNGIPQILQQGLELIVDLGKGLINGIPQLVANIPQIINSIVTGFTSGMSAIWDVGKNIVSGIWEGITSMASWIGDKVKGFFGGIVDGVKGFLGIHSPSTMFADIGGNMAAGVGVGFDDNMDGVSSDMESSLAATSSTSALAAINALNEGLTNNAELLTSAIATIVAKIGDGLAADNAKFIQQGVSIDTNLAHGLINGIVQITAKIPQIVTSILNAYIAMYPKFIQQGVDINKKLAEGVVKSITEITSKVPMIIAQFETAFTGYTTRIVSIGENIMKGIGQGITNMSSWLNRLINNYISNMIAAVEDRLEINSPSKVFAGIGYYMAAGLGDGFAKEMRSVEKDIKTAIPTDFDIKSNTTATRRADRAAQGKAQVQVVQNIYTPQYDYVAQQREAAKQFKLIARQV